MPSECWCWTSIIRVRTEGVCSLVSCTLCFFTTLRYGLLLRSVILGVSASGLSSTTCASAYVTTPYIRDSPNHTVSYDTVTVIAWTPPNDLLALERTQGVAERGRRTIGNRYLPCLAEGSDNSPMVAENLGLGTLCWQRSRMKSSSDTSHVFGLVNEKAPRTSPKSCSTSFNCRWVTVVSTDIYISRASSPECSHYRPSESNSGEDCTYYILVRCKVFESDRVLVQLINDLIPSDLVSRMLESQTMWDVIV